MKANFLKGLRRFWNDEAAFVISSELVIVGTIVTIGMIAGLTSLRDQIVQEFADGGEALARTNHSYYYHGYETDAGVVAGSQFTDQRDFCAAQLTDDSPPLLTSVSVNRAATPEGVPVQP